MLDACSTAPDTTSPSLVLLVDDDVDTCELYRFCLTLSGFAVAEARDGSEALRKAKSLLPDVVVTDIVLPDVDGFSVCRDIKQDQQTAQIPVIALSGYSDPGRLDKAKEAGFDAFLLKPVSPDDLVSAIRKAVLASRAAIALSRSLKAAGSGLCESARAATAKSVELLERSRSLIRDSSPK